MRVGLIRGINYDVQRRRMIAETERALTLGLRHPDRAPRIPTIEVGKGTFSAAYAVRFWSAVLEFDAAEPCKRQALQVVVPRRY